MTAPTMPPTIADEPRAAAMDREQLAELGLAAIGGLAIVWAVFHLEGWNAPFGFVVCAFLAMVAIYGVVVRQRHGLLQLKDRLATLLVGTGTTIALVPLVLVIFYVLRQGLP